MLEKYFEMLSKTLLFKDIGLREIGSIIECIRPTIYNYKKNECIAVAGEEFNGIGIILNGKAEIAKENASGNRVMITILKSGDMFGEMAAFSGNKCWPATVYAHEECRCIFMPPQVIVGECEKMCPGHKQLILNMLKIVTSRALMLNRKVEYLSIKSMRGKISTYLLEQYKKAGNIMFDININRNELAEFLSVSRPSMSREMCRMRDEGIIEFYRSSIRIIDIEKLKYMVEY